jgi:uncharacterized cupin superfamily protein
MADNANDLRVLDLANPQWEKFDPKDRKVGPIDYPDDLTGVVQWVRAHSEGPLETENGSVGMALCHMQGDPTGVFEEKVNEETEIMVLFEGSAEATLQDGTKLQVQAPQVVYAPRGLTYSWQYTSPYRGVYIILW